MTLINNRLYSIFTPSIVLILGFLAMKTNASAAETPFTIGQTVNCTVIQQTEVSCEGYSFEEEERANSIQEYILYSVVSAILVLLAGLFSGLTLGLLSLDPMNLEIMIKGGEGKKREYAKKILPIVEKHHLLLVTLLLSNAACMEALPIFLDRLTSPIIAIVISVTAVLFFGEVIPQAICSRYGLAIGAHLVWFVRGLMFLLFIIAWPISKVLDFVLGGEKAISYRRAELKQLVEYHAVESKEGGDLTREEVQIIKGAIDLNQKTAKDCMTPLSRVVMLDFNKVLDSEALKFVVDCGHSRLPVYEENKQNIRGVLAVKNLIRFDTCKAIDLKQVELRSLPVIPSNIPVYELLNHFKSGKSHMALVRNNNTEHIEGIVTLEDVFEELIQQEVIDDEEFAKRRRIADGIKRTVSTNNNNSGNTLQDSKGMVNIPLETFDNN